MANESTSTAKPEEKKPETTTTTPGAAGAGTPPAQGDPSLIDRIMAVVTDVVNAKFAAFEKNLDTKIADILKGKEVEVERALRKGFGLESDPVIHMSDLIAYGRKAGLEKSEPEKRTPGTENAGPDGVAPAVNPIDKMFDEALGKKEGATK